MKQNEKLKVFVSYSHLDEEHIKHFKKHIVPLETNGLIAHWYDRKITAGHDFQENIDNNLDNADIICLFISANFLSSPNCMKERNKALELRKKKCIVVIPIILSACGWNDDKEITRLLALPIDGKPISEFPNSDNAWNIVYKGLKSVIEEENKIKQLGITEQFSSFLQNTELLTKAHSQKNKVLLEDIFVYPELERYDNSRQYDKKESSKKLLEDICDFPMILIAGEDQSGKTTLCKKIFIRLREKNYVPVYISDKFYEYQGKIDNRISRAFKEQYTIIPIEEIDKKKIVPIIDDFHLAKNKGKIIDDLSSYTYQIVVVDDIFCLNFKDENIIKSFTHFKIKEFTTSLRNQLIKQWLQLTDKKTASASTENEIYENIDSTTELVDTALGRIIGNGIMPAYPFFILSVISIYETFDKPLDEEITSQGFCYQALIYVYLRKQGAKSDEIDTYINFLTEFAFFIYKTKKNELSLDGFNTFMESYVNKYNLPIKKEILIENLLQTQIINLDSFNNFSFCYPYIFYFFIAKYLADHAKENKETIEKLIRNLHKDENAYIVIFMSHHTKNDDMLDEIILNADRLFHKHKPATLSKEELSFFDEQINVIVKAVLPPTSATPEKERAKRLEERDKEEEINKDEEKDIEQTENVAELLMELRRSIKTVEVMGLIIKNRAGSLEKPRLEFIFEEAMKVQLRVLTSFLELIKDKKEEQEVVKFISDRLNKIIEDKEKKDKENKQKPRTLDREHMDKIAQKIFWNLNFFTVFGIIDKIIHSLGSNKLTAIVEKVCDKENTPASFLLKHGILMWYNKNLQIDNITKIIDEDNFSEITKKIMKFMIVNHCSMHSIDFRDKQKIEHKLGIPSQKMLMQQAKKD